MQTDGYILSLTSNKIKILTPPFLLSILWQELNVWETRTSSAAKTKTYLFSVLLFVKHPQCVRHCSKQQG